MSAIERDNPSLKGVLPKDYARPGLDKQRLGQLINLVSDIGLGTPEDRADLFPDSFEDSELGEVPKGWGVGTLENYADLNPETWTRNSRPEEIRYVDLSNTKWGRIEAIALYSKADAPSRAQRILRPRDTIVGTVRPGNGSYSFISEDGLTGSTGFAVLRPRHRNCAEFIYLAATDANKIEALAHLADGAAYPAVRPDVVAATQVVCPPDPVIGAFSKQTAAVLDRISTNDREGQSLAALRDALLPKLVSGQFRVSNALINRLGMSG